jgi:hypothetical protein
MQPRVGREPCKVRIERPSYGSIVTFVYHPEILDELARHGLQPLPSTSPEQLRDAVRDLYKYEIKRLRTEHVAGRIARRDYAGHVVELRKRYWLLSIPTVRWTVSGGPRAAGGGE